MRISSNETLEQARVTDGGPYSSDKTWGLAGSFRIHHQHVALLVISSGGNPDINFGWEHVSISTKHRTPTWEEMCFVKNLFWDQSEVVVQYHIDDEQKVDYHQFCLHLWKQSGRGFDRPPAILVGPTTKEIP